MKTSAQKSVSKNQVNTRYTLTKKPLTLGSKAYTTYGIKNDISCIQDISTDLDFVNSIVKALNDGDVSDIHFYDVVEDFLNK